MRREILEVRYRHALFELVAAHEAKFAERIAALGANFEQVGALAEKLDQALGAIYTAPKGAAPLVKRLQADDVALNSSAPKFAAAHCSPSCLRCARRC